MSNAVLEVIEKRKSIRKFLDQPVPQAVRTQILHAAMRAPSAGAMMLYSIIEVEDQAVKDRMAVLCDHQPFIATSPYVVLFVADYQRWVDYFDYSDVQSACAEFGREPRLPSESDLIWGIVDGIIAAQTAVIAAESLGVGSCYIGDIYENYEINRELFNLPKYTVPCALLCMGYPTQDQIDRPIRSRIAPEFLVFKDKYVHRTGAELADMWPETTAPNPDAINPMLRLNVGQKNYINKFTAPFSLELVRSVKEILKNWQGK